MDGSYVVLRKKIMSDDAIKIRQESLKTAT